MNNDLFNYIVPTRWIQLRQNDKLADEEDVKQLNTYAEVIHEMAGFYSSNLENRKIDYVYKEKSSIKVIPVKYKKENFPHLTGINMPFITAKEKFDVLAKGNNSQSLIIEKGDQTFRKLKILHKLPNILNCSSTTLTQLQQINQAARIGFEKGLKNQDNDMLLALQDFQPEFYTPKSLLNIKDSHKYDNVPENTVLGVFKEKKLEKIITFEPISLNFKALGDSTTASDLVYEMAKYANNLVKEQHEKEVNQSKPKVSNQKHSDKVISNKEKLKTKYEQYWTQRGMDM